MSKVRRLKKNKVFVLAIALGLVAVLAQPSSAAAPDAGLGTKTSPWSYAEVHITQTGPRQVRAEGACKHLDGKKTKAFSISIEYADNANNSSSDRIASKLNAFGGWISDTGEITEPITTEGTVDVGDTVEAKLVCKAITETRFFFWTQKKFTVARTTLTLGR